MASKIYTIEFSRLVEWLVPPRMRFAFLLNWLKALIAPVSALYGEFTRYRKDVEYRLSITPQVCRLEGAMNDAFDKDLRRIYIADSQDKLVLLIHTDAAIKPVKLFLKDTGHNLMIPIIHNDSAYAGSNYDFTVIIPLTLKADEEFRLISLLNTYKLASKRYKILYI